MPDDDATPKAPRNRYAGTPTDEEYEFARAMERYKRLNGVPFPKCSEILAVLKSLGYRKVPAAGFADGNRVGATIVLSDG